MDEVRITAILLSLRTLMITTSGVKPSPVIARSSIPLPVYER